MAEQGFLGVVIPEDAGGMGLGYVELAALAEEMGRALVPGAFISTLARGRSDSRCRIEDSISPRSATATRKATLALLEASASWDPDAVGMKQPMAHLPARKCS